MADLSPAKRRCVEMMLSGDSLPSIAAKLKVSVSLISKWSKETEFRKELNRVSNLVNDAAMAKIIALNDDAITRLREILLDSNDKNSLTAIKIILESSVKWLDKDLLFRLENLESRLGELQGDES